MCAYDFAFADGIQKHTECIASSFRHLATEILRARSEEKGDVCNYTEIR